MGAGASRKFGADDVIGKTRVNNGVGRMASGGRGRKTAFVVGVGVCVAICVRVIVTVRVVVGFMRVGEGFGVALTIRAVVVRVD